MSKKDAENSTFVTRELCDAYQKTIRAEIRGLRDTILVGLSISTTILTLVMYVLRG